MGVVVAGEEGVGGVGAKGLDTLGGQRLDGGADNLLLLGAEQSVVASLRIDGEEGDAGIGEAEVATQALGEFAAGLLDAALGDALHHLAQGQVACGQGNAQSAIDHQGLAVAVGLQVVFDIAALSAKLKLAGVVDGIGDEDVEAALAIVGQGAVEGLEGVVSRGLAGHARLHFYLLFVGGQQIDHAVGGLACVRDDGEVGLYLEQVAVVGCHLGRTVDDGRAQLQHLGVGKDLEYQLVSDTVGIALGDSHPYFLVILHKIYTH